MAATMAAEPALKGLIIGFPLNLLPDPIRCESCHHGRVASVSAAKWARVPGRRAGIGSIGESRVRKRQGVYVATERLLPNDPRWAAGPDAQARESRNRVKRGRCVVCCL